MSQSLIKLESLLETHEQPFVVIGADLHVVAVNRAWEAVFGTAREDQIGRPCCEQQGACRHQQLFQTLEPYVAFLPKKTDKRINDC